MMINSIVWLTAGAVIGWLATMIIRRRHPILLINIIVGSIIAFLVGYLVIPMFHFESTSFSLPNLLVLLVGTFVLLGLFNFIMREHNVSDSALERQWNTVREKIHVRWGKITEEDADQIDGSHDRFIDLLVERYGISKGQAEDQLQSYLTAVVS